MDGVLCNPYKLDPLGAVRLHNADVSSTVRNGFRDLPCKRIACWLTKSSRALARLTTSTFAPCGCDGTHATVFESCRTEVRFRFAGVLNKAHNWFRKRERPVPVDRTSSPRQLRGNRFKLHPGGNYFKLPKTLEPDGEAIGCNPIEVGSTPTSVSDHQLPIRITSFC